MYPSRMRKVTSGDRSALEARGRRPTAEEEEWLWEEDEEWNARVEAEAEAAAV